jgi:hypothetical protein
MDDTTLQYAELEKTISEIKMLPDNLEEIMAQLATGFDRCECGLLRLEHVNDKCLFRAESFTKQVFGIAVPAAFSERITNGR